MITNEMLRAYLDDALGDADSAQVEQSLRGSEDLRGQLRELMQTRDRGEHSVGAVWRRRQLTCPSREEMGSYLLEALDEGRTAYVKFHLETVCCPYCQANRDDLADQDRESPVKQEKAKKIFDSGSRHLKAPKPPRA
jgi:hypothetical protein